MIKNDTMTASEINIVAIQKPGSNVATAWIRQFPSLVVQGEDEAEIKNKLRLLLVTHLHRTLDLFEAHEFSIVKMTNNDIYGK